MKSKLTAAPLLAVGLLQMAGDVLGLPILKAVGAATGASPAPKVFCSAHGLETFSTRFWIEWRDTSGSEHSVALTPEIYSRLRGPYNRRNAYGAALAYGPVLQADRRTRPMLGSILRAGLCGDAPLLRELGFSDGIAPGAARIRLEALPGTAKELSRVLVPSCS
jgi:hypothetical protein